MNFLRFISPLSFIPVIIWLLVQSLMFSAPTVAGVNFDGGQKVYADSDLIEVVICTPQGFKRVKINPEGEIQEEAETYPDCRWCNVFAKAVTTPDVSIKVIDVVFCSLTTAYRDDSTDLRVLAIQVGFKSRAPPSEFDFQPI